MKLIAKWISRAVDNMKDENALAEIKKEVKEFAIKHPMPSF